MGIIVKHVMKIFGVYYVKYSKFYTIKSFYKWR